VKRRSSIRVALAAAPFASLPAAALAQTWTPLASTPAFSAGAMLQLTDGTIMVQDQGSCFCGTGHWWRLAPDNTGSYVNGSWNQLATMPAGYKPLYSASQVLPDGRVIIQGGEYNGANARVWTNKGAIYDPVANSWTSIAPPYGWSTIGDAPSTLLANGTYMLANCCNKLEVTLDLATMTYTSTGTGKADSNNEEGWTLLPSGQILTVDASNAADPRHTEILTKGKWRFAGDSPVQLADCCGNGSTYEVGPQMLRPDGTVLAVGATGYTAIYSTITKTWAAGPTFPKSGSLYYDEADGPAALLPDGNVLLAASPGDLMIPVKFFEFDGANLNEEPPTKNASHESSFQIRLLLLPTGQVLETDGSKNMEVYTPAGSANPAWQPVINSIKSTLKRGRSYRLKGTYLNGFSQAVAYGDDYQAAVNYPLVRIANVATGHVFWAKTSGFSSYKVANPKPVTTEVEIPIGIEKGGSSLEVVAAGIASAPVSITIK
jgi:hypothetical protein